MSSAQPYRHSLNLYLRCITASVSGCSSGQETRVTLSRLLLADCWSFHATAFLARRVFEAVRHARQYRCPRYMRVFSGE